MDWLEAVFDDFGVRLGPALLWKVAATDPPIEVEIKIGEGPMTALRFDGEEVEDAVTRFARDLQAWLAVVLRAHVPPCPTHGLALSPTRTGALPQWLCPEGDLTCVLGDYREAIWPPGPEEQAAYVAFTLSHRFRGRHLRGIAGLSAERRDGGWIANIDVRPEADDITIRAAAAPIPVKFARVGPVTTERYLRPASGPDPPFRALTLRGTFMQIVALGGTLRRAGAEDECDFLVDGGFGHVTRVRLLPEHAIGPANGPVILDAAGQPFAGEGDSILCIGGFLPESHLDGEKVAFSAGELRVFE